MRVILFVLLFVIMPFGFEQPQTQPPAERGEYDEEFVYWWKYVKFGIDPFEYIQQGYPDDKIERE